MNHVYEIPHELGDVLVASGAHLLGVLDVDASGAAFTARRYNLDRESLGPSIFTSDPVEAIDYLMANSSKRRVRSSPNK